MTESLAAKDFNADGRIAFRLGRGTKMRLARESTESEELPAHFHKRSVVARHLLHSIV